MLNHILGSLVFAASVGGICFLIAHIISPKPFLAMPFKTSINAGFRVFLTMAILSLLTSAVTNWTVLVIIHGILAIGAIAYSLFVFAIAAAIAKFVKNIFN